MISFNYLGNLGRLGNQMFQFAALKGIAANRGFDFCLPSKACFGRLDGKVRNQKNIYDVFNLTNLKNDVSHFVQVEESSFEFDENLFNNCCDDTDLLGYFQSEKYFKHIESDIRQTYSFKQSVIEDCKNFIDECSPSHDIIAIHVRRGDYLNLQTHHPPVPIDYYDVALKSFPDIPAIVFSDDIGWCQNQEVFEPYRFYFSESNSEEYDLCLMSLCTHHIIANSSFSWWGAWLANSGNVIAPKTWFGFAMTNVNTKDLYLDHWKLL